MAIKSDAEIYKIIEKHLKAAESPLSCVDLWDHSDVQANARSPEKISDYLGLMWRRGIVQRWDVPKTSNSRSRYAYTWKEDEQAAQPRKVERIHSVSGTYRKANVTITEEENRLVLDFDKFTLTIQAKG